MQAMAQHSAESARQTGMPQTRDEALKLVVPRISDIITAWKENGGGHQHWKACKHQIIELCLAADFAYKKHIPPWRCGIHPERPVDPIHAHQVALEVSLQGYSESKFGNSIGFEKGGLRDPVEENFKKEKFMEENFKMSNGYLKKIEYRDVFYLPVTCSHLFAAANIVKAGKQCRGLNEEMSTGGYIDQAKTLQLCPSWDKPLTEGIPCIVIRSTLDLSLIHI